MSRIALLILLILSTSACDNKKEETSSIIRVGVLPDLAAPKLIEKYKPLIDYLSLKTHKKVELIIPDDYNHLQDMFVKKKIDLAFMGGLTFVQTQKKAGALPLVLRDIDHRFTSYFIARNNVEGDKIADFKGKTFGFGSPLSTSGHLMPRYFLNRLNLLPESFFSKIEFTGAHDKSIYQVLDGELDLAVVNSQVLKSMIDSEDVSKDKIKIIWETPPYLDYVWVVQPDMDQEIRDKFLNYFLVLSDTDPSHQNIMTRLGAGNFLPAKSSDFNKLREVASELEML